MESLVRNYFDALQKKDMSALSACYHDDFRFEDPVIGMVTGKKARNAWRMYADTVNNLKIEYRIVQLDEVDYTAWVHWDAYYESPEKEKEVFNKIDTHFEIKDMKFISQHDDFILKDWAKQVMGMKAKLFGGTKLFQNSLQRRTNEMLENYISKNDL